jgi:hypothetical protein
MIAEVGNGEHEQYVDTLTGWSRQQEREQRLLVLDTISSNSKFQSSLTSCDFNVIWSLARGLHYGQSHCKEKIANFVSGLICQDARVLEKLVSVWEFMVILTGNLRAAGAQLPVILIFLACLDISRNSREQDESYLCSSS